MNNIEIALRIYELHADRLTVYHATILQAMIGTGCNLDAAFSLAHVGIKNDDPDYRNKSKMFQDAADDIDNCIAEL